MLSTRKRTQRKSGIVRRARLLQAARSLLETHDLDSISLGDVAALAKVPKGSAYHFYADIKDLYANLLIEVNAELLEALGRPIEDKPESWQEIMERLTNRGSAYYAENPASTQLQIGPKIPPELKLRDRQNDVALARIHENHLDRFFELPPIPNRSTVFFRAIEIADLMFSLSVLEHGRITPEMTKEASRAMCGYLSCYLPQTLPPRRKPLRPAIG